MATVQGDGKRHATPFPKAAPNRRKRSERSRITHRLCVLGLIDAALGRKEDALREGRRAVELLPIDKRFD